jgi:Flp pilus assembly protein TadG
MNIRRRDDTGAVSTELALVMPFLLFFALMPLQFALWWHGHQAAALAAEECVDAAQAFDADVQADGRAGGMAILNQGGNLTNIAVTPSATADTVVCQVSGRLRFSVVGNLSITARAEGPIERFVGENQP